MNWTWNVRSNHGAMNDREFARCTAAGGFDRVLIHAAPGKASVEINMQGVLLPRHQRIQHNLRIQRRQRRLSDRPDAPQVLTVPGRHSRTRRPGIVRTVADRNRNARPRRKAPLIFAHQLTPPVPADPVKP